MRNRQRGQVAAEFGILLAVLFATGLTAFQFVGLALDAGKIAHAAQEAAYVAAANSGPSDPHATPCWAVTGGIKNPAGLADAAVCRTITENLGTLDADHATVTVTRTDHRTFVSYRVSITYQQPIDSPVLRLLMGPLFTTTSEASSV